jgi:hypothetical protein
MFERFDEPPSSGANRHLVISVIKFGETLITKKHGEPVGFRIFNALSPSR